MTHPCQQAVERLAAEVHSLVASRAIKPGDTRWFEMQAKGCALSMLRGMMSVGAHENPQAAEAYRKSIYVKGKLNGGLRVEEAEELNS